LQNKTNLVADLRGFVYKTVVANGNETDWNNCFEIFQKAEVHEEKIRALRSLGCASSPELIKKTLELMLTEVIRSQDVFYVIVSTSSAPVGREITWKFLQDNWEAFEKRLGDGQFLLSRCISYATKDFNTLEKANEVKEFFEKHPVPSAERTIKQSLESISTNHKILQSNKSNVAKFLSQKN